MRATLGMLRLTASRSCTTGTVGRGYGNHPTQVVLTATKFVTRLCPCFLMVRTQSGDAWKKFFWIFLYRPVLVIGKGTGGSQGVREASFPGRASDFFASLPDVTPPTLAD